jgi:hypothetical protein
MKVVDFGDKEKSIINIQNINNDDFNKKIIVIKFGEGPTYTYGIIKKEESTCNYFIATFNCRTNFCGISVNIKDLLMAHKRLFRDDKYFIFDNLLEFAKWLCNEVENDGAML